jgi:hypothetical protein
MKKSLAGPVLFSSLLVGVASAASKVNVHFQRPISTTYDFIALTHAIDQIMQVLVAAIVILLLALAQGIFFFIRDLSRSRRD